MFVEGDTSLTPRVCSERRYHVQISCDRCRHYIGPAWKQLQWAPLLDVPLFEMFERLRCSRVVNGYRCGAAPVELTVERFTGKGSQMETLLKIAERME